MCGLRGSQKRAGDDGAGHLGAEHGREPPGLLVSGLIERRVQQPSQDAGFVERRLAMPDEIDQNAGEIRR